MFGSAILEVVVGIVFIYILVSVLCTAIREGIESWLKTRAAYLEHGIRELLHDKSGSDLATAFYNHPLIFSLFPNGYAPRAPKARPGLLAKGDNLPSYIPASNFALALMDIAARGPQAGNAAGDASTSAISLEAIRKNVAHIANPAVQRVLLMAVDAAQGDINKAKTLIEAWYNSAMDRVSGWYRRSTQRIIFCIALLLVIVLNVNTFTIADHLYRNDAVRSVMIARAEKAATDAGYAASKYEDIRKELGSLNLPIGWPEGFRKPLLGRDLNGPADWLILIFGWLLTAFAATLGAPFWFDVLNKVMVIRSTVKPHEKSREEASEDRQPPSASKQ
ncbi:MAG TPA: hypothetical protein VEC06_19220 [Paucimonas sp.]|nr:hypothetical protein [Paucimonas sp.]